MIGQKTGVSDIYKETPEKSAVNHRSISDQFAVILTEKEKTLLDKLTAEYGIIITGKVV